jgi:hypothetical protein
MFMTVPLDRLYHYISNIAEEILSDSVVIYRFWPHGSKNINNLSTLSTFDWASLEVLPALYCNDQEPLHHEYYKNSVDKKDHDESNFTRWRTLLRNENCLGPRKNYNFYPTIFEKLLLLHSEKRSQNLEKYQLDGDNIPVYYWCHALISLDWFRYAQHESFKKNSKKTFLIYNRAWSGTREYRLKFAELIIMSNLHNYCQTSINYVEPELGIHYDQYEFKNIAWAPSVPLEGHFPVNHTPSHYSADFNSADYNSTDIEVVLETLFDDDRLHLTEKSLRPIACGQPFILAGTHGSLEYLRSYGFKTFGHIWDEYYDQVEDAQERLLRIVDLMKQIANWAPQTRDNKMAQAQVIAEYNRQHFFSQEFFEIITSELKTNLKLALEKLHSDNNYYAWLDRWNKRLSCNSIVEFLDTNQKLYHPNKIQIDVIRKIVQDRLASCAITNKSYYNNF